MSEGPTKVASAVVSGLSTQPTLLAIIVLNLLLFATGAWVAYSQEKGRHEIRQQMLNVLQTCIRPLERHP